jgi:anti-sigma regulatory factor (Ser/Thr protein kinase)
MAHHPLSTTLTVSADEAATRSARALVRDLCATAAVGEQAVETAVLLVTELVSNAVEHGGGTAVVDAEIDGRRLRVCVLDDDPTLPTAGQASIDAERGRGLLLVEALSSRWGAERRSRGKSVWFELDRGSSH